MSQTVRVGIIGVGGVARGAHIPGYQKLPGVEIVAVSDLLLDRAQEVAQSIGPNTKAYADYREMLANENLDAVSVCTPNAFHKDPTIAALEAGAHVLCEKPIATSVAEGEEMIATARRTGKILTIGLMSRFSSSAQVIRRFAEAGHLGEVYYARAQYLRRRGIPDWGVFHIQEKSGGGALIDIGVHVLDLAMWLMGSPKPVAVSGAAFTKFGNRPDHVHRGGRKLRFPPEEFDVDDNAFATVRFDNGALLTLEVSWASEIPTNVHGIQLFGDRGGASSSPLALHTQMNGTLVDITPQDIGDVQPHHAEIEHFIACVRGEREIIVKPEEALEVQRVLDAIYESTRTGREVRLDKEGDSRP